MIGQKISQYQILEKLGEGGMGVVYKAQDTKLDRLVALKFLPHHLTANEAEQARFLQEAKAAAALNHPNVCAVIDIQEHDGTQFIVMEYVDGETLRKKVPFAKIDDALRYAVQIGEALQEAHSKGIVHRDVKCENIMVNSRSQIKVMDFGLAKLKGSLKLTRTSSTVGTLAYMAPEQIQGGTVDARSDIFSFGVVLFEMLTGKMPFRGEHDAAMMYSIVNEEPDPVAKHLPSVSPEIERIVQRALEKDPEDRYQSIADMVSEIRRVQKQSTRVSRTMTHAIPAEVPQRQDTPTASIAPPVPARSSKNVIIIAVSMVVLLAVAAGAYMMFFKSAKAIDSLAVLPFINASGDPQMDYLSDGISEGVINSLTRIHELRVIPRSTMFRFKGKDVDPQEIGTKLSVGAVLSGTVKKEGDNVDIQVDLIDVQKQSQIWGDHFSAKSSDLLTLQQQIIDNVSKELQISVSGASKEEVNKRSTQNGEAYQLYLQGRFYWNKRNADGIERAIDYFNQAIALDTTFALAYVGLADCYVIQPQYAGVQTRTTLPLAESAAEHALRLDNSLAEAHTTLAFTFFGQFRYDEAEKEFKQAIALNPRYATAYHWYGLMEGELGHFDLYLDDAEKAQQIDPYSPVIALNVGAANMYLGHYEDAMISFKKCMEIDPSFAIGHAWIGNLDLRMKNPAGALPELQKALELSGRSGECLGYLGYYYGKTGNRPDALKILNEEQDRYRAGKAAAYSVARIYISLGDKDKAIEWLQKDYDDRSTWISALVQDFVWDDIRTDPRFIDIEKKVGLVK
jgi:serine/threonine protein kinase/tetratricopeptide (TPR) repeat protein